MGEEIESSHKGPKFKVDDRVRIIKYKKIGQKIFVIDSVLTTNLWTYKKI